MKREDIWPSRMPPPVEAVPIQPYNAGRFVSLVRKAGNFHVQFWDDPMGRSFRYASAEDRIVASTALQNNKPVTVTVLEKDNDLFAKIGEST